MKRKVQAQRKFAQGAYIPPSVERRNDVTPIKDNDDKKPAKNIFFNSMSACHLLDMVSMQNLHHHGDPIVLVERLYDRTAKLKKKDVQPSVNGHREQKELVKLVKPKESPVEPSKKIRKPLRASNRGIMQLRSRMATVKRRLKTKRLVRKQLLHLKNEAVVKKKIIVRKRPQLPKDTPLAVKKKCLVPVPRAKSPILSEFSTDDDTPLNQITRKRRPSVGVKAPVEPPPVRRKRSNSVAVPSSQFCTLRSAANRTAVEKSPKLPKAQTPAIEKPSPKSELSTSLTPANLSDSDFDRNRSSTETYYGRNEIEKWLVDSSASPPDPAMDITPIPSPVMPSTPTKVTPERDNFKIPRPRSKRTVKRTESVKKVTPDSSPDEKAKTEAKPNERKKHTDVEAVKMELKCVAQKLDLETKLKEKTIESKKVDKVNVETAAKPVDKKVEKPTVTTRTSGKVSEKVVLSPKKPATEVKEVLHPTVEVKATEKKQQEKALDKPKTDTKIPKATSKCPSHKFTTFKSIQSASQNDLENCCKTCVSCKKIEKLLKIVMNLRSVFQKPAVKNVPNDVYAFDENESSKEQPLLGFRQNRRKAKEAAEEKKRTLYLDLLPQNSSHIVQLVSVKLPNQEKTVMRAGLVPKADVGTKLDDKNDKEVVTLMEQDNFLEQLLSTLNTPSAVNKTAVKDGKLNVSANKRDDIDPTNSGNKNTARRPKIPEDTDLITLDDLINATGTSKISKTNTKETISAPKKLLSPSREESKLVNNDATKDTKKIPTKDVKKPKDKLKTAEKQNKTLQSDSEEEKKDIAKEKKGVNSDKTAKDKTPVAKETKSTAKKQKEKAGTSSENKEEEPDDDASADDDKAVEAPTFRPTESEFENPIAYIEKITPIASKFGLCKIIPPKSFKPECHLSDTMKFMATNQYPGKMYRRWGPATRELCGIKTHLATQKVFFKRPPLVDGMEVDLPKLYHIVQRMGGLSAVIEQERWQRVAEEMHYQKGSLVEKKLDQVYVKYLLPYDTLTNRERQQITSRVERDWSRRYARMLSRARSPLRKQRATLAGGGGGDSDDGEGDDNGALDEADDCVVVGRCMNLPTFKKIANNVMRMRFPHSAPSYEDIEAAYWRLVADGAEHVCVNTAAVDTGAQGLGFTNNKADPMHKHPWNLKSLSCGAGSLLRALGAVLSVTVPTLHLGMLFSTSCWHRDPHALPWTEYLHDGPPKIWYGIPAGSGDAFRAAVRALCPAYCQNKAIWLPSDVAMVPPALLTRRAVPLCRLTQRRGEFVVVFPKAYSCSICTGFTVSESVYFAPESWLSTVLQDFEEVRASCEPTMFSLEQVLISIAMDARAPARVLPAVGAALRRVVGRELSDRRELRALRAQCKDTRHPPRKKAAAWNVRELQECDICRATLYISKVTGVVDKKSAHCLPHALQLLAAPAPAAPSAPAAPADVQLVCYYTDEALEAVLTKLRKRLGANERSDKELSE